jgi:hypothetical protein
MDGCEPDVEPGGFGEREADDVLGCARVIDTDDAARRRTDAGTAQSMCGTQNDDGAGCVCSQPAADRTDQQSGETTEATRANHDQLGRAGFVEHHRARTADPNGSVHAQSRRTEGSPSDGLVEDASGGGAHVRVRRAVR